MLLGVTLRGTTPYIRIGLSEKESKDFLSLRSGTSGEPRVELKQLENDEYMLKLDKVGKRLSRPAPSTVAAGGVGIGLYMTTMFRVGELPFVHESLRMRDVAYAKIKAGTIIFKPANKALFVHAKVEVLDPVAGPTHEPTPSVNGVDVLTHDDFRQAMEASKVLHRVRNARSLQDLYDLCVQWNQCVVEQGRKVAMTVRDNGTFTFAVTFDTEVEKER